MRKADFEIYKEKVRIKIDLLQCLINQLKASTAPTIDLKSIKWEESTNSTEVIE